MKCMSQIISDVVLYFRYTSVQQYEPFKMANHGPEYGLTAEVNRKICSKFEEKKGKCFWSTKRWLCTALPKKVLSFYF